ncbi:MAG: CHAT domain-containing protein, partial [Acidobacteriota bacterium]|nr:CHAT domain-containing protein [Acidobacteriota bacterium]
SFAALMAPSGKYLVEDVALHYAPSANALDFTSRRRSLGPGPVVVIADPAVDPALGGSEPLPRLPGAAREGRRIARIVGAAARLLEGPAATEETVRQAITGARVLHFATHGIIRDDRPFDSFLALAGPNGSDPDNDGRLSAAEVYGLPLSADLVVLGACRSAAGPVTGDGIVGLTRGIFAAGTPSVMASLWDLPDAFTASVFPAFYQERQGARSKADALRRAQLSMIRNLRAGRVSVDTPAGRFVLPEHPSIWAALILVGEP